MASESASEAPRGRGVRLGDLDRSQVYRIGYVGRRWEVLGPEGAPDAARAPDAALAAQAAEPRARQAAPERAAAPDDHWTERF